jgi:hypothetical protein
MNKSEHPFHWGIIKRQKEMTGSECVFISSTCYDLVDLRYELYSVMTDWGLSPILSDIGASYFEYNNVDSISTCLQNVDRSEMFVSVLSQRYSTPLKKFTPDNDYGWLSAFHVELCRAMEIRHQQKKLEVSPLPVIIFVRDVLNRAYKNWEEKIDKEELCKKLSNCCSLSCQKPCTFSSFLNDCNFYLSKTNKSRQKENSNEFIKNYCDQVINNLDDSWLSLFPITSISEKALNRYRLQALAQFFLLHILYREEKNLDNNTHRQPIYIKTFKTVTDLKEKIYPLLIPNIQKALFLRALTDAHIPVLSIEIPNISAGAPSELYLIIKNASLFPVIWTEQTFSSAVYQISKDQCSPNYRQNWTKCYPITSFESVCSALLPGDSVMARLKGSEIRNTESQFRYFLQLNYRTTDNLYVADIFEITWSEHRLAIQFVEKIPDHPNCNHISK